MISVPAPAVYLQSWRVISSACDTHSTEYSGCELWDKQLTFDLLIHFGSLSITWTLHAEMITDGEWMLLERKTVTEMVGMELDLYDNFARTFCMYVQES